MYKPGKEIFVFHHVIAYRLMRLLRLLESNLIMPYKVTINKHEKKIPTIATAEPERQLRAIKNLSTIKLPQNKNFDPPKSVGIANSPNAGRKTRSKPT